MDGKTERDADPIDQMIVIRILIVIKGLLVVLLQTASSKVPKNYYQESKLQPYVKANCEANFNPYASKLRGKLQGTTQTASKLQGSLLVVWWKFGKLPPNFEANFKAAC